MSGNLNEQSGNQPRLPEQQTKIPGLSLAIAALVLGVVSIPFSLFLIGGIYGLIGLIIAVVHLKRSYPLRGIAVWGLCLSVAGVLMSLGFGVHYLHQYRMFRETMATFESQGNEEWIDVNAPDFSVKQLDGKEIRLSEYEGQKVILDFWATWCGPCRMEIPHFIALRKTYDPNDLVIIGISSESAEVLRSFAENHNINYTLAIEPQDLPSPYADVTSIPTTFFIDKKGVIKNILTGYHDFEDLKTLAENLDTTSNTQSSNQ